MKTSHLAVLALALTGFSSQAMGWGADGHRAVAAIALKLLPPDKAQAADNLLNNSDVGRGFVDAASYADSKAVASQTAPMQGGKARLVFTGLAPGRYALRAFADENGNGKLDTNLIGMPAERYGFSNDAKGNRAAPAFEAAAISVEADLQTVIHLR